MHDLFNKVSHPLTLSQTLDCIAADTNYMNIYSHIHVKWKQNRDMTTTKCNVEYFKVLQSLCTAKIKEQIWYIIVFKYLLWLKLSILKKYTTCT